MSNDAEIPRWKFVVLGILCLGGVTGLFDKEDKAATQSSVKPPPTKEEIAERERRDFEKNFNITCRNYVRSSARFSSKVDFRWDASTRTDGTQTIITGTVELMNGFGSMIPHTYRCVGEVNGSIVDFDLNEGG